VQRERSTPAKTPQLTAPEPTTLESRPVTSLLPRSPWMLALFITGALLSWAGVVGVGAWLDVRQLDPWQGIFGLQAGRLLRFYTTVAFLSCAQLSYLILWRRSRSRKDFAGRYRVWFWIGAVCSVFCVASATRFHESWAFRLTSGLHTAWIDAPVLCWMVPATTMLMSALHLLRRDLPVKSASTRWIQAGRWLAISSGAVLLVGSLFVSGKWLAPVQAALGALWPTVLGCGLLTYARYVTYVTNEADREKRVVRKSRWMTRITEFATQVNEMAREEWQVYLARREQARLSPSLQSEPPSADVAKTRAQAEVSERATAPQRKMKTQAIEPVDAEEDDPSPAPAIPAPHFPISVSMTEPDDEAEMSRSVSRKERKKAKRA
jgi:hypothetical protein